MSQVNKNDQLLIEDLDPNEVWVNSDLYNNSDIYVKYAQALDPWRWTRGYLHALGMAIFLAGIIAIYIVLYLQDIRIDTSRLRVAIHNMDKSNPEERAYIHRKFTDRMSTHLRAFTYRRPNSWLWRRGFGGLSLGMAATILVGWAYPTLYVFTQKPWYRVYQEYGPPGLASRAGMIAIATIPFIFALSMKANWISLVTGVGHERLNVLHRWLGLLCLFFSIVHTIPFLVEPVKGDWGDGPGSWEALREKLYHGRGNIYYWNGFAALGCLIWSNLAGMSFFRRLCYEFFVHIHILNGVAILGLLFWHCHNKLTSWHYLWATVILWSTGLVWRFIFKTNWFSSSSGRWFSGDTGVISRLTSDGVKITITTNKKWKPGQHVFLRIPGIAIFDNHPFTIASIMSDEDDLPSPSTTVDPETKNENRPQIRAKDEYNDMILVFKPYQGFTRKLYDISRNMSDASYRVLLDGPYGGMPRKLESFDTVLLIAGGSGITPVIGHLQDLCRKIRKGKAVTQDVRVVWTVKRFEALEWFKDEISLEARSVPWGLIHCQYFVTEESPVEFCDYPISATQQWPTSPAVASSRQGFGDSPRISIDEDRFPMPALPGTAITTTERMDYPSARLPIVDPQQREKPLPAIPDETQKLQAPTQVTTSLQTTSTVPTDTSDIVESHPNPFTAPDTSDSKVQESEEPTQMTTSLPTTFTAPDTSDIVESHPNPFTTPVAPLDADNSHQGHLEITDSHPNPFSTPTGFPEKPQEDPASSSDPITIPPPTRKPHSKKPSLRVSTVPEIPPEQVDGIFRVTSPTPRAGAPRPNIGPDGQRLSYGPGDFGDEVMIEFGRPRLREGIRPWAEGFGRRTCIYVCGPESMRNDVSNAVASLQHDIWRRTNQDREEVYLHTETFGY